MNTNGNLEALIARVLDRARAEAGTMIDRAAKAAERDLAQAQDACQKQKEAAADALREGRDRALHGARAEARLAIRRARLNAREAAVEKVFADALRELAAGAGADARGPLVLALIAEAAAVLGVPKVRAQLNAAERAVLARKGVPARVGGAELAIDEAARPCSGGPVVTDETGRMVYENTFEARLARRREALRRQVAEWLHVSDAEGAQ